MRTLDRHTGGSPDNASVATTSTLVAATSNNRGYLLIQNDSDVTIYVALNAAAELNKGIRLNAGGGSYEINFTNLFTGPIYAIHGGSGIKNVCVQEGL